jgi:hypothetical protein
MPKSSSASKATLKKQAQKANAKAIKRGDAPADVPPGPAPARSKRKGKNDPPRRKQFVAPTRPKGHADPVDT